MVRAARSIACWLKISTGLPLDPTSSRDQSAKRLAPGRCRVQRVGECPESGGILSDSEDAASLQGEEQKDAVAG